MRLERKNISFCSANQRYSAWPAYKGEGGGKLNASAKRDRWALVGKACHDAIVFFIPPSQL